MTKDNVISIECLDKILNELDYDNYLFSKPTSKLKYYSRKVLKMFCELINYFIKFTIFYILAYAIYKIVGPYANWTVLLLASYFMSKK